MPATHRRMPRRIALPTTIVTLCVAIGLLAGCGSSSPNPTAQRAGQTPLQSNADVGGAYVQSSRASSTAQGSSRVSTSASHRATGGSNRVPPAAVEQAKPTPAQSNDDLSRTPHAQFNPCTLVSVREAQEIVGVAITGRVEAPLGPTCVYKLSGSKANVTLAVESLSIAQVTRQMKRPKPLIVGSRRAYCGRLGTQMLFAPLTRGRLLNVTAPCPIAQRFAALALGRLAA